LGILTRDDARKSIVGETEDEDPEKTKALADAALAQVEVEGRRRYFGLRTKWSWIIFGWISVLIIFNMILTYKVGVGSWKFEEYQWFITAVTVETFLQIVGMGYIAVKFLFSHK
jgi:hypothetical protein